jgi:hypothetical protein
LLKEVADIIVPVKSSEVVCFPLVALKSLFIVEFQERLNCIWIKSGKFMVTFDRMLLKFIAKSTVCSMIRTALDDQGKSKSTLDDWSFKQSETSSWKRSVRRRKDVFVRQFEIAGSRDAARSS